MYMELETLTSYEKAPTTHRSAERLAKRHGFRNLTELAQSLPPNAHILDVGAGASPFGKEVAKLRSDIQWTNFDYSYKDPKVLEEVSIDSPPNIKYVQGDATKLSEAYPAETFDAVFSYWLFPHLSIDDTAPANESAKGIFRVTKKGGIMSVGPRLGKISLPNSMAKAFRENKADTQNEDSYAQRVVNETRMTPARRKAQKLSNKFVGEISSFFGTRRPIRRPEGSRFKKEVYDPKSGEYIKSHSRRSFALRGEVLAHLARKTLGKKTN